MPTPEENMQSVRAFAEEVFGNKNLDYAADWLADNFVEHQVFPGTTPDKKTQSIRIAFSSRHRPTLAPGRRWTQPDARTEWSGRPSLTGQQSATPDPRCCRTSASTPWDPCLDVSTGRSVRLGHGNLGHHPGAS